MVESLKIFTQQLRNGHKEKIDLVLSPDFLDLKEKELLTPSPVTLKGEAYCVDDLLMIALQTSTEVKMPCSICNTLVKISLQNENILLSLPLSELPSAVVDYTELLREELIMIVPQFAECKEGACPQRKEIQPYLKTGPDKETHNFPFADL